MKTSAPTIRLAGDRIDFAQGQYGWTIQLDDLRVIGEFTTPDGPLQDDYFVCFVTGEASLFVSPIDAAGCSEVLADLGRHLGTVLEPGLANSTEYASRVLWPTDLVGEDLFNFRPLRTPGWLDHLLGRTEVDMNLSVKVRELLR